MENNHPDTDLEKRCDNCDGQGHTGKPGPTYVHCHACGGDGVYVTEFGEKVLEFVKRRIRLTIDDVL